MKALNVQFEILSHLFHLVSIKILVFELINFWSNFTDLRNVIKIFLNARNFLVFSRLDMANGFFIVRNLRFHYNYHLLFAFFLNIHNFLFPVTATNRTLLFAIDPLENTLIMKHIMINFFSITA